MKSIYLFFIVLIISACGNTADRANEYENSRTAKQVSQQEDLSANANVVRKVIKTANIRFQVRDLIESTQRIEAMTAQYNGFIASMNQNNSNYSINNQMTLRVPVEQLEQFLTEIENEAIYLHYKRINVQDVTEEFVDKTSRLNTKKEVRDRYIAILRDKAKTVKEVLDAEEKIRVLQEEIEAIEGRLKYLGNQTAFSTVHLDMYEQIEYKKSPDSYEKSFFTKIKQGFVNGWQLVQDIIIGLVNVWPLLIIVFALFLGRNKIRRIFERNKTKE